MSVWPTSLIPEVAQRRCILFLGAGASAGCQDPTGVSPPDWPKLLQNAVGLMRDPAHQTSARLLIAGRQYLDAAEVIFSDVPSPDIRGYLRETFLIPKYKPSRVHELVREIDPKIVITTNYDEIYDQFCKTGGAIGGYSVCKYHDDNILEEIRSTAWLIIKAHGCITQPNHLVLSRSQYFQARKDHPGFYSVLDSLFLTSTLLFIGCGLSDPDIQLVLENVNISVPCTHPHYALVPAGTHPALSAATRRSHNIQLVEYENASGDHAKAVDALQELSDAVRAYRATHP